MDAFYTVDYFGQYHEGKRLDLFQMEGNAVTVGRATYSVEEQLAADLREWFPEGLSSHGVMYLLRAVGDYNGVRESFAESVRRSCAPEKLSRFQAVFACPDVEGARRFAQKFRNAPCSIWEVKADHASVHDLTRLTDTSNFGRAYAHYRQYWTGELGPNSAPEVLLRPPVIVGRHVENCIGQGPPPSPGTINPFTGMPLGTPSLFPPDSIPN